MTRGASLRNINAAIGDPTLLLAERDRRSLHTYTRSMWHVAEPGRKFVDNWHIGAICEVLEEVTAFRLRNVVINIPFRCMKSLLLNVAWPSWVWARYPERRWIFVSHKDDLATRDSVKCRRVIESAWYQARFGHVYQLTSDQNAKSRYENDKSGYRLTGSVGGSVIGEGGDYRVVDDPHKTDTSESDEVRKGKLEWLREEFSSRFIDPERNGQVIIMQRLNDADMSGFVLAEQMADYHLCIPMRYEERRKVYSRNATSGFTPKITDPRKVEGELMWPARFSEEKVVEMETTLGSYGTAGQLQQRPTPRGGGIVRREDFKFYRLADTPAERDFDMLIDSWDMAFKDSDSSSYVVGQKWGRVGGKVYLLKSKRDRLSFSKSLTALLDLRAWMPPSGILVEDKANGPAIIDTLKSSVAGIVAIEPRGSKIARAEAVVPQIEAGSVYLPDPEECPWVETLISEWTSIPNGAFMDQVDAMSQALDYLSRFGTFSTDHVVFTGMLTTATDNYEGNQAWG